MWWTRGGPLFLALVIGVAGFVGRGAAEETANIERLKEGKMIFME